MKPVVFLRIASILTLIHAALHTIGGVFGKPIPGVATMVAATMRSRFPVFGVMRSYSDFYLGMGFGSLHLSHRGGDRVLAACLARQVRRCAASAYSSHLSAGLSRACTQLIHLLLFRPCYCRAVNRGLSHLAIFTANTPESEPVFLEQEQLKTTQN